MSINTNNTTITTETTVDVTMEELNTMLNPETSVVETTEVTVISDADVEVISNAPETPDLGGVQFAKYDSNGRRTREWFLNNVGPDMTGIGSIEAALNLSGMNFKVVKIPVSFNINQDVKGMPPRYVKIPDQFALVRDDTRAVLGVVGKNYEILQNIEAFNFLDSLVEAGAKIETAGTYGAKEARSFVCMSLEDVDILGDNFTPYFLLMNGFDGLQTVKCAFLTERVYCHNMVNRAFKNALASFSIRHSSLMNSRLDVAHKILSADAKQIQALKGQAELLALKPFTETQFLGWAHDMFPIKGDDLTKRAITLNTKKLDLLMECYREDDLANVRGTAWGAIQAVSDFETHLLPARARKRPELAMFDNVTKNDMPVLNNIWNYVENI